MKLLLNGGGSTKELEITMNKLNEIMDHSKPILYVPLAMDENEHPYDGCYEWFQKQITNIDNCKVDMARTFEEFAKFDFNNYSSIFIGGGNTYKLLKGIKENGIFEKIQNYLNNGGIISGCSAGAVIFGKDINIISTMDKNDVNLIDTKGFDCLNGISIFPHYTNTKSKLTAEENEIRTAGFTKAIMEFSNEIGDVLAVPEEDTIYINDDSIELIGSRPYYECKNGIMEEKNIEQGIKIK